MDKNGKSKTGTLFVLAAPSGAGKTTLANFVLAHTPGLARVITYTTRPPRPREVNGQDYHFITLEQFEALKDRGFFFETVEFSGNWYGSPREFQKEMLQGHSFLAVTDIRGLVFYKKQVARCISIWLTIPSLTLLTQRLQARGTEDEKTIARRLSVAKQEMEIVAELLRQQPPIIDVVIVNQELAHAQQELLAVVQEHI